MSGIEQPHKSKVSIKAYSIVSGHAISGVEFTQVYIICLAIIFVALIIFTDNRITPYSR